MIKLKMSLNQSVTNAVNEIINSYIKQIATKYNLDINELLSEWNNNSEQKIDKVHLKKIPDASATDSAELDQNTLSQYKKLELQAMCRQRALKCTGTKDQLIGFLLGKEISSSSPPPATKQTTVKKPEITPVAKKLTSSIPTVAIRRNQYGNHEHAETSLVFDTKTKKAIGKQKEDGTIEGLTTDDIDTCNQWKFQYVLPNNLDKSKLSDVKIEELEDEEIESDTEEPIAEEEEIAEEELVDDEDNEEEYEEEEYEDEEEYE